MSLHSAGARRKFLLEFWWQLCHADTTPSVAGLDWVRSVPWELCKGNSQKAAEGSPCPWPCSPVPEPWMLHGRVAVVGCCPCPVSPACPQGRAGLPAEGKGGSTLPTLHPSHLCTLSPPLWGCLVPHLTQLTPNPPQLSPCPCSASKPEQFYRNFCSTLSPPTLPSPCSNTASPWHGWE